MIMDVKLSREYWRHPAVENGDRDVKLCGVWLLSNASVNFVGYAEVSLPRFTFETGSPSEALAKTIEAFGDTFLKAGRGYWIRNYIERQYGRGPSLVRNNYCKPLLRDLHRCPEDVVKLVLDEYPELKAVFDEEKLNKHSPRGSSGLLNSFRSPSKERRGEDRIGKERKGADRGIQGGAARRGSAAAPVLLAAQPWAPFARRVGAMFRRRESTPWSPRDAELAADLFAAGAAAEEDLAALEAYYRAEIPEREDHRRRDLGTLLANWSGEVDRARKFAERKAARGNPDGLAEL